ncbi:hypothetical protein AB0L14_37845 [Streptomyces sp. NPDC052727]|uniref:hypothetical protein n=1 Tax=Streptomyces sp. NPDC052727 TaxID=3154854 RepID=UPI00343650B4
MPHLPRAPWRLRRQHDHLQLLGRRPAWREQLVEGGHLVLPLEIGGYTRTIEFERRGEVLHARTVPVVHLLDGKLTLRFDGAAAVDTNGLEEALRGRRQEVATGVTMRAAKLLLRLPAVVGGPTLSAFCRLVVHQDPEEGVTGVANDREAPAIVGDASLAYLIHIQTKDGEGPEDKEWEWIVHAFSEEGPQLAEQLAVTVWAWDRHVRAADNDQPADPVPTIHPAGTPDHLLPAGDVLDKASSRLVFRWPGRDRHLPAPARRTGTVTASAGEARSTG